MKCHCSSSIAAGWTSCAVDAMSLLGEIRGPVGNRQTRSDWPSSESVDRLLGWLVSRQTSVLREEDHSVSGETEAEISSSIDDVQPRSQDEAASVPESESTLCDRSGIEPSDDDVRFAGFTGRCNKAADTCYAFWAGGSLAVCSFFHEEEM